MPDAMQSQREPELSGARAAAWSGREPELGGERRLDWGIWCRLLDDSEPVPTRLKYIPKDREDLYFSALLSALPGDATYSRQMQNGRVWRSRYTHQQRLSAISLLGGLRDRRAVGALARQLDDPSNHVRVAVIMALGWIGGPVAVSALIQMLKHPHESTRAEAARWLGWAGSRAACEALVRALADPVQTVWVTAATSLARLNDPRAFGPLVEAFWKCQGAEQARLLEELRRYDLDRTIRMLIQARGHSESRRYAEATMALRRLGTPEALAALRPYDHRYTENFDSF